MPQASMKMNADTNEQWRFYVGARGHSPPPKKKNLAQPPPSKFLDTVVLLLVELIGSIVNFA